MMRENGPGIEFAAEEEMEMVHAKAVRSNETHLKIIRIALELLSKRLMTYLSLVVTAILFFMAMEAPADQQKLLVAAVFAGMVFWPTLFVTSKENGRK